MVLYKPLGLTKTDQLSLDLAHIPGTDNVSGIQLNHFLKTDSKDIYGVGFAVCKEENSRIRF